MNSFIFRGPKTKNYFEKSNTCPNNLVADIYILKRLLPYVLLVPAPGFHLFVMTNVVKLRILEQLRDE